VAKQTAQAGAFNLKVEFSREDDRRWIADIPALPGVTVYGRTRKQALVSAEALALRVIADRLEHGEAAPGQVSVSFAA
jgi:predicted RNase H-like HicB family nuclease